MSLLIGTAKWLLTVESAALAVELPFEYLISKLGKAIGAGSSKMAECIADRMAEAGRLSCSWKDYQSAFLQYFSPLPTFVSRDAWSALSMYYCGSIHKFTQSFQKQVAEVSPSEAEKVHTSSVV